MSTSGNLLGTFAGPAWGQQIEIESGAGWAEKHGRYVVVQMDNGDNPLNLNEVVAFGGVHVQGVPFINLLSIFYQSSVEQEYTMQP